VSTISTYVVTGMSCEHCVASVREEIGKLDGVKSVEVELSSRVVTVESDRPLDPAAVSEAVDEAGYEVVGT
jgi:copper chaperone